MRACIQRIQKARTSTSCKLLNNLNNSIEGLKQAVKNHTRRLKDIEFEYEDERQHDSIRQVVHFIYRLEPIEAGE